MNAAIRVHALGHVVLRVRDLARSVAFYRDVLGLREVGRYQNRMVFFSISGNHHDLALLELGADASPVNPAAAGMYHFALKVGNSLDELRAVRSHLLAHGLAMPRQTDHKVTQSLYLHDPDGIELELYVDADPTIWRDDPSAVATIGPLHL